MSTIEELDQEQVQQEVECCPRFNPDKWNNKTFEWDNKKFIKSSIPELFHVPFPPMIAKKVIKMMRLAEEANMLDEDKLETLLLFNDPHPFKGDIYLSVRGDVPGANKTTLTGTFMSKVFEGEYSDIPKLIREMDTYLATKDKQAKTYYVHYAYCPKCTEKFKHNYMVFIAHVG